MRMTTPTVLLIALAMPRISHGQDTVNWLEYDAETCQLAVQSVGSQVPSAERGQALWYLRLCGSEGADALAQELIRLRMASEPATLTMAYGPIASVVDAAILNAALELAADRGATRDARLTAFRLVTSYRTTRTVSPSLSSYMLGNEVHLVPRDQLAKVEGRPLPTGWERTARVLFSGIASDSGESEPIRYAARWALSQFRS